MKQQKIPVGGKITGYLEKLYGAEWTDRYREYTRSAADDFIRVNTLKSDVSALREQLLARYDIQTEPVAGVDAALRISDTENIAGKTIHHITGAYYIQSLSSMIPVLALAPQPGERVLDLCAAPGSKTTFIAAQMRNTGMLAANELQANRSGILSFNLERMSALNTGLINSAGELLSPRFPEYFDRILVDAPCSGLGIVHKKGEVSNWWNPDLAEKLSHLQYRLLLAAVKMLRPGGTLVYSTCTLTVEENEAVVNKALQKLPLEVMPCTIPVISENGFASYLDSRFAPSLEVTRRIIPWQNNSEGFYIAKLRKTGSIENEGNKRAISAPRLRIISASQRRSILDFFEKRFAIDNRAFEKFSIAEKTNDYYLMSSEWENDNFAGFNRVGLKIGSLDNYGNFIFHTNAAQIFAKDSRISVIEIDDPALIKVYLEGGTIKSGFDAYNGQVFVRFRGTMLGAGVVQRGALKSRFPRAFRTQAMIIR